MSEYPKIETLFERDKSTFVVNPSVLKSPVLGTISAWDVTEKIDGMNIRVMLSAEGDVRFAGRTDAAQLPGDLVQYLMCTFNPLAVKEAFFWEAKKNSVVLYGEGYGAGIQKGGTYRPDKAFILFDVLVGEKCWLSHDDLQKVAESLGIDTVPYLGRMGLEQIVDLVRAPFPSRIGTAVAEGVVARPIETLFNSRGKRVIIKLKTRDFQAGKR